MEDGVVKLVNNKKSAASMMSQTGGSDMRHIIELELPQLLNNESMN